MKRQTNPTDKTSLKAVKQQIQHWRKTRTRLRPIPEEIWQAAAGLTQNYSMSRIAQELGLNYTVLKKRVKSRNSQNLPVVREVPGFAELGLGKPVPGYGGEIELEAKNGTKLKISLRGSMYIDLLELSRQFLQSS